MARFGGGEEEEEKLFEMVCDFIESSSPSPTPLFSNSSSNSRSPSWGCHRTHYSALKEIIGRRTNDEMEVHERVLKHMRNKMDGDVKKWLVMKMNMDGYNSSLFHTSWVTSLGCPAGDYEYIEVVVSSELNGEKGGSGFGSKRLIVDIDFKSQFELARPTKAYKELIEKLIPNIFVGDEDKLSKIVSILCSAAKQSLNDRGLHIPPWRTTSYMHCKWLKTNPIAISLDNGGQYGDFINQKQGEEGGSSKCTKWAPPRVNPKPKRRDIGGGGSALSSQFSNMSINCC